MRVVRIDALENRMTRITVAKRFLIFFWRYIVYQSYDVKIPYEMWEWVNVTDGRKVLEPSEYWMLDEFTRGDRLS